MTIMGEALSKLGKGMERILRNKLDAIPQAPAITLVLAPLGKLMADKIYDATIASNLAKLPNVKDALLAMTDEDLRKITLPEIERILTRLPRSPNFSTGMSASSGTLDL